MNKREIGLIPGGKFKVERADGDPTGKHRDCFYFVLDVEHDPHALPAIAAYAESCEADGYGPLAADLRAIVASRTAP